MAVSSRLSETVSKRFLTKSVRPSQHQKRTQLVMKWRADSGKERENTNHLS